MSDRYKKYLVCCSKCGEEYARYEQKKFTCRACLNIAYPRTFYRNRAIVLERDGYKCQCCGDKERNAVHHIDCNKKNNSTSNLITLCNQCHRYIHGKYTNEVLRRSNIYKLFPKSFRWGQFGKRFGDVVPIIEEKKKIVPKMFKNIKLSSPL